MSQKQWNYAVLPQNLLMDGKKFIDGKIIALQSTYELSDPSNAQEPCRLTTLVYKTKSGEIRRLTASTESISFGLEEPKS